MLDSIGSHPVEGTSPEDLTVIPERPLGSTAATVLPRATDIAGDALSPGTLLGPYRLLSLLGQGGMGAVYRARHEHLDKIVALKILSPRILQDADAVSRFKREMKAVGKLDHPQIIRALDAGEIAGTYYLAMEFIEGVDLQRHVREHGPLSIPDACEALRQAALALAAAHAAGLVHRDLKPANLLLGEHGRLKLLDLGLARLINDPAQTTELTQAGQTFGTPDYMAPEQWSDARTVDARSDLYALGCTFYFLLTGHAPYEGPAYRTAVTKMKGHVLDPAPDLQTARPEVPVKLVEITQKLLSKAPEDRYQTATELLQDLTLLGPLPGSASRLVHHLPGADTAMTGDPDAPTLGFRSGKLVAGGVVPPVVPPRPTSTSGAGRRWMSTRLLLGAGAVGAALLLGVVIITITQRDGTTTTIKVPAGLETEIEAPPGAKVKIAADASIPPRAPVTPPEPLPVDGPAPLSGDLALEFDGRSSIEIPSLRWDGQLPMTIEARVNSRFELPDPKLIVKMQGIGGLQLLYERSTGWTGNMNNRSSASTTMLQKPLQTPAGPWDIALVVTTTQMRLYENGKRIAERPVATTQYDPTHDVSALIGSDYGATAADRYFQFIGTIDEVRISKIARYDADYIPAKRHTPDPQTIALYHFDEGQGKVLTDTSGNGHHGQLAGPRWVRSPTP